MFVEICLAIITSLLVALAVVLIIISTRMRKSIHRVQIDLNRISTEVSRLASSLNQFVRSDLHGLSKRSNVLIGKLTDLASDINYKSHSLNFLFNPLRSLTSKLSADSSSHDELSSKCETIPQILKWIVNGVSLIKSTREVVKKL